ncbi:winged helix-turn-helix domain-containing protein [Streptomyces sp. NPDC004838]
MQEQHLAFRSPSSTRPCRRYWSIPFHEVRSWWAADGQDDLRRRQALERLLGASRAAVLRGIENGCTTGELARRIGLTPPAASRHATALREADLIASRRWANKVVHVLTPLGAVPLAANPD